MTDTVEQPALVPKEDDATATALARVAGSLDMLASVLAALPEKNPTLWETAESAKQLKDLNLACSHLRQHARELEDLVTGLKEP